jgi:hypothetical protein
MAMWKVILKGEEVHPSVKGFETRAKAIYSRLRKDMIKFQEEIEEIEKLKDTDDWEKTPKPVQDRLLDIIKDYKEKIEKYGKIIGSKFGPQHDKFPMTPSQRLRPSTKKPKVKRMDRPSAFSFNPRDTLDSNVMRRFNISEKDFNAMSRERKDGFRQAFKLLEGDK